MKVLLGIMLGMIGVCVTCCAGLALLWVGFQLSSSPETWKEIMPLPEFLPQLACKGWVWSLLVLGGFALGIAMMRIGFAMFDRTAARHMPTPQARPDARTSERRMNERSSDRVNARTDERGKDRASDRVSVRADDRASERANDRRNKTTQSLP
jgi:hypothetical protein